MQHMIDNLPNSIEELELDEYFDLELNNLPTSIHKVIFSGCYNESFNEYNRELNCLPNFVEFLQLPQEYNKKILRFPSSLKTIKCSKSYKFLSDFSNYNVEYYD